MELNNMSQHDHERIAELQQIGFELVEAGFRNTHGEQVTNICYWRHMRGCRVSALFPNPEAAWRDAIRTHEAAVDAVEKNPGVRVVPRPTAEKEAADILKYKGLLIKAGFSFHGGPPSAPEPKDKMDFQRYKHYWKRNGKSVGTFFDERDAVKDALKIWARDNPGEFVEAMAVPQHIVAMNDRHDELVKECIAKGIHIDLDKVSTTVEALERLLDYKAAGVEINMEGIKHADRHPWKEVKDKGFQHVSKGFVSYFAMQKVLECVGYKFEFTARCGWYCPQVPPAETNTSGAISTAVKAAWRHALANGGVEEDMLDSALAYEAAEAEEDAAWDGTGQPPIGTTLWVNPHNTLWGFNMLGDHLCKVLAYHDDYVWLEHLSDIVEATRVFIITRNDKVDCRVWKGNLSD